ncbi:pilin [Photobacterium leiognathi]|uniref:pilin n=1 Tax=Photobacterium leiognathi TaxID=553611 RepID=UPI00273958ED|nr:pilin [Photobacterium leiognathi]
MKKQQGFTLIELMIVVAVIGVLSAIAIPQYQNYVSRSEAAAGVSTMRSLLTNVQLFEQENGAFPDSAVAADMTAIGAATDMSSLGTLALDGVDTITFTFDQGNSSIENASATFQLTANGWECTPSAAPNALPEVDGCM